MHIFWGLIELFSAQKLYIEDLLHRGWTTFSRGENESHSFRPLLSRSLASIFFLGTVIFLSKWNPTKTLHHFNKKGRNVHFVNKNQNWFLPFVAINHATPWNQVVVYFVCFHLATKVFDLALKVIELYCCPLIKVHP